MKCSLSPLRPPPPRSLSLSLSATADVSILFPTASERRRRPSVPREEVRGPRRPLRTLPPPWMTCMRLSVCLSVCRPAHGDSLRSYATVMSCPSSASRRARRCAHLGNVLLLTSSDVKVLGLSSELAYLPTYLLTTALGRQAGRIASHCMETPAAWGWRRSSDCCCLCIRGRGHTWLQDRSGSCRRTSVSRHDMLRGWVFSASLSLSSSHYYSHHLQAGHRHYGHRQYGHSWRCLSWGKRVKM